MGGFLSTLSLRRATGHPCVTLSNGRISIHALLAESDKPPSMIRQPATDFYPRSPCGERLLEQSSSYSAYLISIHALLAESDDVIALMTAAQSISIHALLAESDFGLSYFYIIKITISIHALLAESDVRGEHHASSQQEFLSTLSLRRATCLWVLMGGLSFNFYPRSPCGERPHTS